jgi:hypothetical protein
VLVLGCGERERPLLGLQPGRLVEPALDLGHDALRPLTTVMVLTIGGLGSGCQPV